MWPLSSISTAMEAARVPPLSWAPRHPVPHRAKAAENVLIARHVDEAVAGEAARAALAGATPLSKNAYKLPLFEALVRRAILKATIRQ